MKINDLEKLLGIKRSNIFYYEREGLLVPAREDNNYREYSEDDLRRLKAIVVLRKLGFTVAEIRSLLDGERELSDVLPDNMARLTEQRAELVEALALCRELERRGLTMEEFDADEWFETVENEERQGKRFLDFMGDMADDVTRTVAFVRDSTGLHGPVFALFFLSEEGIRKRRLWKLYWFCMALFGFNRLVLPMLLPGAYMRPAHPVAAVAFLFLEGIVGSAVLALCARYVIPGRPPRQALWIIFAITLAESVLMTAAGLPATEMTVDEAKMQAYYASIGVGSGYVDDPLEYIENKYRISCEQLQSWQGEDRMFVFLPKGAWYEFQQQEDGTWLELRGGEVPTAGGTLYTAAPGQPYPSRLMLADGTVVEPVYEARVSDGYIPLFAFDVSGGRTYRGLLYGVDGSGGLHFGLETGYVIRPKDASDFDPDAFRLSSAPAVRGTEDGPAFLAALRDWRAAVWQTEPTTAADRAYRGVSSGYLLHIFYDAPNSLVADIGNRDDPVCWEYNEFTETVYLLNDGVRYVWNMTCGADILPLLQAGEVTPELLRTAAQSVDPEKGNQQMGFASESYRYTETKVWDGLDVPEGLLELCWSVRQELG